MPIEIPGLIQDVFNMLGKGRYCTITNVNKELEDLRWGIEIMDNVTSAIETADNTNRDRRSGIERRQFSYNVHIPERRSIKNRRNGKKRR